MGEPKRNHQLIFCDMGVNPTPWGYSAYDEIIQKLIARGIPQGPDCLYRRCRLRCQETVLFEKVRMAGPRFARQHAENGAWHQRAETLVALHELDAPWKPAEVEQREGRILRQGNENKEVAIYRYVTEGSLTHICGRH